MKVAAQIRIFRYRFLSRVFIRKSQDRRPRLSIRQGAGIGPKTVIPPGSGESRSGAKMERRSRSDAKKRERRSRSGGRKRERRPLEGEKKGSGEVDWERKWKRQNHSGATMEAAKHLECKHVGKKLRKFQTFQNSAHVTCSDFPFILKNEL